MALIFVSPLFAAFLPAWCRPLALIQRHQGAR